MKSNKQGKVICVLNNKTKSCCTRKKFKTSSKTKTKI